MSMCTDQEAVICLGRSFDDFPLFCALSVALALKPRWRVLFSKAFGGAV